MHTIILMDVASNALPDLDGLSLEQVKALLQAKDAELAVKDAQILSYTVEIESLRLLIRQLRGMQYGKRSEKRAHEIEQLELLVENLETAAAEASRMVADRSGKAAASIPKPRRDFPAHLPRETLTIVPPEQNCPGCGGGLKHLGEDVCEILELEPVRFKVVREVRPKLACAQCDMIVQAPAPTRPIERGMAGPALLAHVLVGKYGDHTPLYRQAEIYAREGVELERSLLAQWVGNVSALMAPLTDALRKHVLAADVVHADDTPLPVLAPGLGKTKTGRLWTYVRDERPSGGLIAPAVWFAFSSDRKGEHPQQHLEGFRGILQADGFTKLFCGTTAGSMLMSSLAGCSGQGSTAWPTSISSAISQPEQSHRTRDSLRTQDRSPGFADADAASTGSVIVSDLAAGDVYVYTQIGKLVAKIVGLSRPWGLALDALGDVYVAQTEAEGIPVYKNDYKTLITTLSDPYPSIGVAVDTTTGTVAAINTDQNPPVGNVTIYANGSSTPCANLSFNQVVGFNQGAFDRAGNLYVTAADPQFNQVVGVIRGGCSATTLNLLTTANSFSGLFGIQVTPKGKIAIEDQGARTIYTYNPPVNGALGTPIATTPLTGIGDAEQFAFTKNGAYLFVADSHVGKTFKYAYPAGGAALKYIAPQETPSGVLAVPAAQQ